MGETMISVRGLWKVYGPKPERVIGSPDVDLPRRELEAKTGNVIAMRDIDLDVAPGEVFVVMGLSGSGKSTLVRCLTRLIEPTAGSVHIAGVDVTAANDEQLLDIRRNTVSMVFQHFGLLPHRTLVDNVAFGLEVRGNDKAERRARAAAQLDLVGLGGMGSALDPLIRREMQDEVIRLRREVNKTMVFITHDLSEALRIGDRIAIMRDGRFVQVGTPAEVVLNPADDYVRNFVRDVPRSHVVPVEAVMRPAGDGPFAGDVAADTKVRDVVSMVATTDLPLRVVGTTGAVVGAVSRSEVLAVIAGGEV
jgi:glycine betaine/proline transport system ATP-binding protein